MHHALLSPASRPLRRITNPLSTHGIEFVVLVRQAVEVIHASCEMRAKATFKIEC